MIPRDYGSFSFTTYKSNAVHSLQAFPSVSTELLLWNNNCDTVHSMYDAFWGDFVIGYADNECFSKAFLAVRKVVGRIYSQSRGRGRRNFSRGFAPRPPQIFPLISSPLNPKYAPRSLRQVTADRYFWYDVLSKRSDICLWDFRMIYAVLPVLYDIFLLPHIHGKDPYTETFVCRPTLFLDMAFHPF